MITSNKIVIKPSLYNRLGPFTRQYFQPGTRQSCFRRLMQHFRAQEQAPRGREETAFDRAMRCARTDNTFNRVYPLVDQLSEPQRVELAEVAVQNLSGKTDCVNFARNTLEKFSLSPEGKHKIVQALDQKTGNFVTQALNAQYGGK